METKFTPGPWVVNPLGIDYESNSIFGSTLSGGARQLVATVTTGSEASANARLIAAAPELLAALEAVDEFSNSPDQLSRDHDGVLAQVRAAIAKAGA